MKSRSYYLGDATFWKLLGRIALPISLQNLLSASFSLVDTLMVGQLGDLPLSAVGMAGQFGWFLSMILFGLTSGMSMFASQYFGAKDTPSIRKVYGIALLLGCGVAGLFTFVGVCFPRGVLFLFNRDPEVMRVGAEYLSIAALSYIAIALNLVFMGVLRSTESVKLPLFTTLASALLNCILNYLFIFGGAGIEAMGAKGAAVATVISSFASPLILFSVSLFRKNILIAPLRELFRFGKAFFLSFLRRGAPVIANETLWGCGTLIFNIIFSNLGVENYAAITILRTFESIAFVFFVGLCNASCVIVGKSTGAGEIESAVRDARRFTVLVPLVALGLCGIIQLFAQQIVGIFDLGGNISPTTLSTAVRILRVYALELPCNMIPYILICGVFRPGGETKKGMQYDLLFLWAVSLPVCLLAAFLFRLPFPLVYALTRIAEDWPKAFCCIRFFRKGSWLRPVTKEGIAGLERYRSRNA